MPRTRELLRSIKNLRILREIAVTEGALKGVGDLIDNFLDSEAMVVSIARFKASTWRCRDDGAALSSLSTKH